jgi:hypothetical protein
LYFLIDCFPLIKFLILVLLTSNCNSSKLLSISFCFSLALLIIFASFSGFDLLRVLHLFVLSFFFLDFFWIHLTVVSRSGSL